MKVKVLSEHGYEEATFGLGLSHGVVSSMRFNEFYLSDKDDQMTHVAFDLAHKDTGENKFLESIIVWLDITAPRYWWMQFDTYRVGVTKQSESTMHSIMKRKLVQYDFAGHIPQDTLQTLNEQIETGNFDLVIKWLPQSYFQRRIVCTNYKTLRHICQQRQGHKLKEWQVFIGSLKNQLMNEEFLHD